MGAGAVQRRHQRGIVHAWGLLQQRAGLRQGSAQLADVPALDDGEAVADDAPLAHLHQQFARAHPRLELVLAHLQAAAGIQAPRQQLPLGPVPVGDPGLAELFKHAQERIAPLHHQRLALVDAGKRPVGKSLVAVPRQPGQRTRDQRGDREEQADAKPTPAHRWARRFEVIWVIRSGYLGLPVGRGRAPAACRGPWRGFRPVRARAGSRKRCRRRCGTAAGCLPVPRCG